MYTVHCVEVRFNILYCRLAGVYVIVGGLVAPQQLSGGR
jgi:hypothetical protein